MNQKIAIYAGEGASGPFPPEATPLSTKEVLHDNWDENFSVLILPGGRDRPYHAALKGAGNTRIRSFVEQGGIYLGICAGAYYGCARIEFDRGSPGEICEERELCFFSGSAVGPAFGPGSYKQGTSIGARAALLQTSNGIFHAYHNGGAYFTGDFTGCRILAAYLDLPGHPPAILECPFGKGRAILCAPHLERSASSLDPADPHLFPLIPILQKSEPARASFWNQIKFV